MYVKFTEHNDHEGETWNFYFPYCEKQVEILQNLIDSWEDYCPYSLSEIEDFKVDVLVEHSDFGYMPQHNKLNKINLPENLDADALYKGGIMDYQIA